MGGVDGLIHITDLSWGRVKHPSDVVKPNQEVDVKIMSLDPERERIQLGYKQLQPKPWDNATEKYPEGCIVEGKVVRITDFGAFVELEPGLDGLVHISQCAKIRIAKVEDAVQVGEIVRVKVLGVDPEKKRISLLGVVLEANTFSYILLGDKSLGISLFGLRSELTFFSGAGSAGGDPTDPTNVSLREALEAEGYRVNPTLHNFIATESRKSTYISEGGGMFDGGSFSYKNAGADNLALEIPLADFPANIALSYPDFSDVAIVVFGRQGSEGSDSYRGTADTIGENGEVIEGKKHYLELTDDEEELLEYVKAECFKKVIVLINTGVPMEMGNLEKDDRIDAILWIGMPGAVGMTGTAKILSGDVNPSGKTVDIWAADFKQDPTYVNFNDNEQTTGIYAYANTYAYGEFDETKDYAVGDIVGRTETTQDFRGTVVTTNYYEFTQAHAAGPWNKSEVTRYTPVQVPSVEYEEGIYAGYRYYETRAAEYTADPDWYETNVVYPFGYGLSYTSFDWELVDTEAEGTVKEGDQITLSVKVTNTGDTAGKDVVEAYVNAPYTKGG